MAALEILALDEATPQIRAPGSGDTYVANRPLALIGGAGEAQMLTISNPAVQTSGTNDFGVQYVSGGYRLGSGAITAPFVQTSGAGTHSITLRHDGAFRWSSGTDSSQTPDLSLYRDAANTLALRNGTNAQAFNVYNTYTDASNYERGSIKWNANVLEMRAENAGTGTIRPTLFNSSTHTFQVQGGNKLILYANEVRFLDKINLLGPALSGASADTMMALSQTWNTTGTPTAIKLDVTDTASNASSLLMDLRVGGASRFSLDKTGALVLSDGSSALTIDSTNGATTMLAVTQLSFQSSNAIVFRHGNGDNFNIRPVSTGTGRLAFLDSSNAVQALITTDAANTLALRNGTNAQAFNVYNTYTDASNYERAGFRYVGNALEIGHQAAGTGSNRDMRFVLNNFSLSISTATASNDIAYMGLNSFSLATGVHLKWSSGTNAGTGQDTGLVRNAAAVVKVTNGSSGIGELIFKVPTVDPGITGALWNNGGTLSISA